MQKKHNYAMSNFGVIVLYTLNVVRDITLNYKRYQR